jgi:hypothetical protein
MTVQFGEFRTLAADGATVPRGLEREPGERDAFLEEACKGDEDLRRKLTLLLAEDASKVKILDSLCGKPFPTERSGNEDNAVEGTHLGAYVIEARLGAGGMGKCIAR